MFLAAGGVPSLELVVATLAGGSLAAGSANALNCYVDRDIDALMRRTSMRPLALSPERARVSPRSALIFGLVLGVLSTALLWATTNPLATGLTVAAIVLYVLGYTIGLKRRTSQNIVWGGTVGCMPVHVQIAARHADPRTTTRYDRARGNLDRHANYIVAAFIAGAA